MNAGLDAGTMQKMCDAGSMPDLDFGENLKYLFTMVVDFEFPNLRSIGLTVHRDATFFKSHYRHTPAPAKWVQTLHIAGVP